MSRRRPSRGSDANLANALVPLIGFGLFAWIFSPAFRTVAVVVLILLIVGGVGYLLYRRLLKQRQAELDFLARPAGGSSTTATQATPPALPPPPLLPVKPRYVVRKSVLTKAEITFHKVLLEAIPEAPIFPKVRVADVMDAAERYSGDFLRISQKHFDWVLCHPVSFEPLVAIELDDSSHQWSGKQRKNDQVKDDAAREAGIALLRFPWQRDYNMIEIRDRITVTVNQIADAKDAPTRTDRAGSS